MERERLTEGKVEQWGNADGKRDGWYKMIFEQRLSRSQCKREGARSGGTPTSNVNEETESDAQVVLQLQGFNSPTSPSLLQILPLLFICHQCLTPSCSLLPELRVQRRSESKMESDPRTCLR